MSMEFRELIDKEELQIDSMRLSEWKRNAGRQDLIKRIDDLAEAFISDNISAEDFESIIMIYKFINKIKDII